MPFADARVWRCTRCKASAVTPLENPPEGWVGVDVVVDLNSGDDFGPLERKHLCAGCDSHLDLFLAGVPLLLPETASDVPAPAEE